jgi:methanogenic corrinoid protein MtbC1
MGLDQFAAAFRDALVDIDRDVALGVIRDARAAGTTPEDVVFRIVIPALDQRTWRVTDVEAMTLVQNFMTAQIAIEVTEDMIPRFAVAPQPAGRVVIGTAVGDLHTLGKRIVVGCLRANMIECTDLGESVRPERFVDEAVATGAEVIAISAMMVHTARDDDACLGVRRLLHERALEDRIKVIVGGAPFRFDPDLWRTVQADGWAEDGVSAAAAVSELIGRVHR